jgi:hypothetical protein
LSISSNKKQQETMSEVPAWSLTATDLEDLPPLLGRSDSQKDCIQDCTHLHEQIRGY